MGILDDYKEGVAYPNYQRPLPSVFLSLATQTAGEKIGFRNTGTVPVRLSIEFAAANESASSVGILDVRGGFTTDPLDGVAWPADRILPGPPGLSYEATTGPTLPVGAIEFQRIYVPANGDFREVLSDTTIINPGFSLIFEYDIVDDIEEYTATYFLETIPENLP